MPSYYKKRKSTVKMKRKKKTCHYCGCPIHGKNRTIDHKKPKSRGGSNHPANLVIACVDCNKQKGDMSYRHFMILKNGEKR